MSDPVAIIGAGPAGLAAAQALASRGIACAVFDDSERPGGQYLRQLPVGWIRSPLLPRDRRMAALPDAVTHPLVSYHPDTTVWAFPEPKAVAYAGPVDSGRLRASAIIIAAGAQDRPCPLPGWTLPGVITAGGCLNQIKGQGLTPEGDVVIAGNGPLVLLTAAALLRAGARVRAVVEAGTPSRAALRTLHDLLACPEVIVQGIAYYAALFRAGVSVCEGWTVVRAEGTDRVERVVVAPLDEAGRPVAGRGLTVDASCLVVGYGLQPNTELTRLAGCAHTYVSERGGWVPVRTASLETSVTGLYAIGEAGGIGGADIARAEGKFVGETIAHRLGRGVAPSPRRLHRLERVRLALERLFALSAPLDLADPETLICRCEEITRAELLIAARADPDLVRIKVETRLSMGRCQGRNCLAPASAIVAAVHGRDVRTMAWPRMRPPARPIPVASLLT